MAKILCSTRGGEASYKAQDAAINLALELEAQVLFLFVVDTKFLDSSASVIRRDTVAKELEQMGEFLLLMAVERAKKQGVESSYLIRHGGFRRELLAVAADPEVVALVLGEPSGAESFFSPEALDEFARKINEETNTQVYIGQVALD
ncbi:MAG: universal stress protein [Anaerolineales bacterium]|nr:universal stress protein [Anaerolineales bacterium]